MHEIKADGEGTVKTVIGKGQSILYYTSTAEWKVGHRDIAASTHLVPDNRSLPTIHLVASLGGQAHCDSSRMRISLPTLEFVHSGLFPSSGCHGW